MRVSQSQLLGLLSQNVLELRFYRRHTKSGWSDARRMLVTNDSLMLNSAPGKIALHFKPPTHPPSYNWRVKNLACGFDLFWQEYRMIPVETCEVITVFPTRPPDKFWNYFNLYLQSLSPQDKIEFMNH